MAVTGYRLPPGGHGLHIHAVGLCEPPEFTSAGAHFNPGEQAARPHEPGRAARGRSAQPGRGGVG